VVEAESEESAVPGKAFERARPEAGNSQSLDLARSGKASLWRLRQAHGDSEGEVSLPWTSRSIAKHNKRAKSAKQRRQLADIANSALKSGHSEGEAIRMANGVLKRERKAKTLYPNSR
jgi:hypothetical protein